MRECYTRPCNFYYGNHARKLVKKKRALPLAGNINIDQLKSVFPLTDIVDVSGALETNKVKDINKIKQFLEKVKKINYEN